jgi:competence protein ComEC
MIVMNRNSWIVFCLAYIIGLFATGLFYFTNDGLSLIIFLKLGLGLFFFWLITKFLFKVNLSNKVWLIAIAISILAVIYFYLRIPQPQPKDLSYSVDSVKSELVRVTGKVLTEPRLNSNQKIKFWLQVREVTEVNKANSQTRTGKLYVTLPLLEGNQIYPQDLVTIEGVLYKPQVPIDSQQFNFQRYLQEHNTFAGLTGFKVINKSVKSTWGWYRLRNRIVRSHVKGLGSPVGQLVSSMVLGQKAVDLPEDLRDLFIKGGLAHVLAASGFQISLLLGITLKLTYFLTAKKQLLFGCLILLVYTGLTGFSPSVLRALIMGIAVLIAIVNKAKIRTDGSLLLAATILLLFNPLWIWNLSFQLSFLATLGLIITLPALEKKLDWLPTNLATAIALPLAASVWTIPLISYVFNIVATYSILVNILATPLITIISLGGMFASVICSLVPSLGSYLIWLLKYPTLLLIALTRFFTNLPGSTWAIGEISLFFLLIIYGLIILIWLHKKWQKRWLPILVSIVGLIIIPLHYQQANLLQVTVLNTNNPATVVIQDRGQVILINSGVAKDIKYNILPFLASQGLNRLDYVIVNPQQTGHNNSNLKILQSKIKIDKLFCFGDRKSLSETIPVVDNSPITTNSLTINSIDNSNALQLTIDRQKWLIADRSSSLQTVASKTQNVLLWLGQDLNDEILNAFSGKVAIAKARQPSTTINERSLQIYTTDAQGTISWTPTTGFTTSSAMAQRNNNF